VNHQAQARINVQIQLNINGKKETKEIPPWHTLLHALRDGFKLKGTKTYCNSGICGACTVLVDGEPVSSCIMLAAQVDGKEITTIEGVATEQGLHPIQQAFVDNQGLQCGYCTPGMVLLTKTLLEENPRPSREEIARYLGGNICRCTGYARIVESVIAAAEAMTPEQK